MRILIVGASGFLGSFVYNLCKNNKIDVIGSSSVPRKDLLHLDITALENIAEIIEKAHPDCVINCAAMTNIEECEKNPSLARAINAEGPRNLTQVCQNIDARLVHVSTDSIFDGKVGDYDEKSKPHPINVYAKTKVEGEQFVSLLNNHVIVRTNFYGLNPNGKHLLNWIVSNIKHHSIITGFTDVMFNPLWVADTARILVELAKSRYQGILHCASDEKFTKYDFIRNVVCGLGYTDSIVIPGSLARARLPTPRPRITTLKNSKMHDLLKTKIRTLDEVLCDASFDKHRADKSSEV